MTGTDLVLRRCSGWVAPADATQPTVAADNSSRPECIVGWASFEAVASLHELRISY